MLRHLDDLRLRLARRSPYWVPIVAVGLIWLKLRLLSTESIIAIGWATHDDRLFLNLAEKLLKGEWLGPYSELTLAKGCFYSIWIALTSRRGIPLLLSQHLLYLAAVLTLLAAIRPLCRSPVRLLLLGALLWFNPATYSVHFLRVIREGIYPALTLLVVAGVVGILLRRKTGSWLSLLVWMSVATLSLGAFWQTREEGVWVLPLCAVALLVSALDRWWRQGPRGWVLGLACALPLVAIPCSDYLVGRKNHAAYGISVAVEFRAHDFLAAYGALMRVKPKTVVPHVLVSKETRALIYDASPAFSTVKAHLEGAVGRFWWRSARTQWPDLPESEIGGGWFMWGFREAVARAGHYASGAKAMEFYRQMAREVDDACKSGKLDCLPARASMMPPWRPEYGKAMLAAFFGGIPSLVGFEGLFADPGSSLGDEKSRALYRTLTHDRLSPSHPLSDIRVQGWMLAPEGVSSVAILDPDGSRMADSIAWLASPDVAKVYGARGMSFPQMERARFDIVVPSGASLEVGMGKNAKRTIVLDGSVRSSSGPDLLFALDSLSPTETQSAAAKRAAANVRMLNRLVKAYQLVFPMLALLALLAFVGHGIRALRRRAVIDTWAVSVGLAAVLVARLAMLSLIEVTSFSGINPMYLSPAYPLLILVVFMALQQSADLWARRNATVGSRGGDQGRGDTQAHSQDSGTSASERRPMDKEGSSPTAAS
jgi:hypothetical protein